MQGAKVAVKFLVVPSLTANVLEGFRALLNQSLSHPYLLQVGQGVLYNLTWHTSGTNPAPLPVMIRDKPV